MADYTTQMDCVRTFLGKVHTVATYKHYPVEATTLSDIVDASFQRGLVHLTEPMSVDGSFIWKRYKIECEEPTEADYNTAIDNIVIGINKFNKRTAITGFTYASAPTMCHIKFDKSDKVDAPDQSGVWLFNVWIDVEWRTA